MHSRGLGTGNNVVESLRQSIFEADKDAIFAGQLVDSALRVGT